MSISSSRFLRASSSSTAMSCARTSFPSASRRFISPTRTVSRSSSASSLSPFTHASMLSSVMPPCKMWCSPCRFCNCRYSSASWLWVIRRVLPASSTSPMSIRSWVKWYSSRSCALPVTLSKILVPSIRIFVFFRCPSFSILPRFSMYPPWAYPPIRSNIRSMFMVFIR